MAMEGATADIYNGAGVISLDLIDEAKIWHLVLALRFCSKRGEWQRLSSSGRSAAEACISSGPSLRVDPACRHASSLTLSAHSPRSTPAHLTERLFFRC